MSTTIIVAIANDRAIGRRGDMIAHISADLKRFKQLTMGHALVMGRKTFESLPGGALPGRRNIVITRNSAYTAPGIETVASLDRALKLAADYGEDVMIIGGGEIYSQAMPLADKLEITEIDTTAPDADTHFPALGPEWHLTAADEWLTDPRSGLRFRFTTYTRFSKP